MVIKVGTLKDFFFVKNYNLQILLFRSNVLDQNFNLRIHSVFLRL